ncbi:hypothetical protein [Haladaptatus sp. NG-SE-30]
MRLRPVVILVLVLLVATSTMAGRPPQLVCEPCGSGFEQAAAYYGDIHGVESATATDVEYSTATIHVYENETAIWTVRNRLTSERTVRFFRENETAFTEIARNADHFGEKSLLSAWVVGNDTVVLRYRSDEQVSRTRGGVLRFDGFRDEGSKKFAGLGADELTVIGPSGTVVTRAPTEATVRGNELTLTTFTDRAGDGPFVTFARSGGVVGDAWSFVSVSESLVDDVVRNLIFDILLPASALFALLVGFVRVSERTIERDERTAHLLAGIVTVLGILSVLFGIAGAATGGGFPSGVTIAGGAYTALALLTFADVRPTVPRIAVGVLLAWLFGVGVMAVGAVIATDVYLPATLGNLSYYFVHEVMFAALSVLLLLSMALVGYAVTDPRYRKSALALPPTILAVSLAVVRPVTLVRTPLDFLYSILVVVLILVVVSLFGIPAFLLGRTIPTKE